MIFCMHNHSEKKVVMEYRIVKYYDILYSLHCTHSLLRFDNMATSHCLLCRRKKWISVLQEADNFKDIYWIMCDRERNCSYYKKNISKNANNNYKILV